MKQQTEKKGSALLLTLLIMTAIFTTAISFASFIVSQTQRARLIQNSYIAYYEAESYLEEALYKIRKEKKDPATLTDVYVEYAQQIGELSLTQDRSIQFDIFEIASLSINCQGEASNSWIEITHFFYQNYTPAKEQTTKYLRQCSDTSISTFSIGLDSGKNYSFRIKAMFSSISKLTVNAKDANGENMPIYSELIVTSSGQQGLTKQVISVRMPKRAPVTEFFDYVLYSEKTIQKDVEGPPTNNSNVPPPDPPVAAFSGTPTSDTAPLTVNFTDLSSNSPTSWLWTFGDSDISYLQNPSHQYLNAGTYTVSLTATNDGGSDSETKTDYITVTSAGPCPSEYDYQQEIVISNDSNIGTITNFPLMVRQPNAGSINFFSEVSDQTNLTFVESDGTPLNYEIDTWNSGIEAIFWVKVPEMLTDGTDKIYMCWGGIGTSSESPSNVWSDYMAVYHFDQTAGDYIDSTGNNNCTTVNVYSRSAAGEVGKAPDFESGSSNYVSCGPLITIGNVTQEAWISLESAGTRPITQHAASGETEPTNIVYGLELTSSYNLWQQWEYNNGVNESITSTLLAPLTSWTYIAAFRNTATKQLIWYLNDSNTETITYTNNATGGGSGLLYIGKRISSAQYFDGKIDELRISDITKSSDYFEATYKSINNNSTFLDYQTVED